VLIQFLQTLRAFQLPVGLREWLDLLAVLQSGLLKYDEDLKTQFYQLAKLCCVKDEKYYDRFDQAFAAFFQGIEQMPDAVLSQAIPDDWLRQQSERQLSAEALAQIQQHKNLAALLEQFNERLREQHKRHQGGNKMVGTGGQSPFGAYGDHPEGIRLAGPSRRQHAVKVWEQRRFRELDAQAPLQDRQFQLALRRLRRLARQGPADQLDLDATIQGTAEQGGWLDLHFQAERRNSINVLIFFDSGGSMDAHVQRCEMLFSAAKAEFKHMDYFYFHNFFYEQVWRNHLRRSTDAVSIWDILHTYGPDYKVIVVGDATMGPFEIDAVGGSVEHWNTEAGAVWLARLQQRFKHLIWLTPQPIEEWKWIASLQRVRELTSGRVFPLTVEGISEAMQVLLT
jgi:hypothetical protein